MYVTGENVLRSLKSLSHFRQSQDRRMTASPSYAAGQDYQIAEYPELEPDTLVDPLLLALPRNLAELAEQTGPLPTHSVVVGLCEDGMPLTIDLTNPSPGSILILGDRQSGKTRLLRTMLKSVEMTFPEGAIGFSLITREPGDYLSLTGNKNCLEYLTPNHSTMLDLIANLNRQVEERRRNSPGKTRVILAIDDLASCLQWLDEENYLRLASIARHGPRYGIWTFAVQDAESIGTIDRPLLSSFRTHFFTHLRKDKIIRSYFGLNQIPPCNAGDQACTPFGIDWLRFWILDNN
jgi:hypothetical protein